jgi:uncharacterized protein YPO0396
VKLIEKRKQLCQALRIAEDELRFVGELIEVREEEEDWEGAIERLLHNFALSLLVPEKHYAPVMQWVDRTSLGMRLVYYRIQLDKVQAFSGQPNPFSVAEKLNIKPDTPFGIWLTKELRQRFCAYLLRRNGPIPAVKCKPLHKAGQIKTTAIAMKKTPACNKSIVGVLF